MDVHLSSVRMSCLPLSLFVQSFSRDHIGFFFLSETEKKLSSEVSALKTELDLCRAEMETERQTPRGRNRLSVPGWLRQKSGGMLLSRRP